MNKKSKKREAVRHPIGIPTVGFRYQNEIGQKECKGGNNSGTYPLSPARYPSLFSFYFIPRFFDVCQNRKKLMSANKIIKNTPV